METNSVNDTPILKGSNKSSESNASMFFSQSDDFKKSPFHVKEGEEMPIQKIGRF